MKARLLQFVTGTSGVPSLGFMALQRKDGSVQWFTLHGVALSECLYPRVQYVF
jgi:E3 ubiquitin-protein ligase NEDD4